MHIEALDLNLLRVFDAVHATRSVSRAAERLGLSQPAVSHAVTRLRVLLNDPLFVRAAGGVSPTPKATELADAVREALHLLEGALLASAAFDPSRATRTFRLHMSDIGEGVFLPGLMAAVRQRAPAIRIETEQLDADGIDSALETGRIDLAFGYLPAVTRAARQSLLEERYVVLTRRDHPLAARRLTRAGMRQLEYIVVRSHAATAQLLRDFALADRIRLSIPHFMVIPSIVGATDLAVIVPFRTARAFAGTGPFAVLEADFALPRFTVSLHWSARFAGDPGNRWLRALALELFRETGDTAG